MHILSLSTDIFNFYPATVKFKIYQTRWQIGDIYVSGDARKAVDNPQGLGCYLVSQKSYYISILYEPLSKKILLSFPLKTQCSVLKNRALLIIKLYTL